VPGPLLVMRLPSTTTLFSISLGSDSLLHIAGKAVAFLPCTKGKQICDLKAVPAFSQTENGRVGGKTCASL